MVLLEWDETRHSVTSVSLSLFLCIQRQTNWTGCTEWHCNNISRGIEINEKCFFFRNIVGQWIFSRNFLWIESTQTPFLCENNKIKWASSKHAGGFNGMNNHLSVNVNVSERIHTMLLNYITHHQIWWDFQQTHTHTQTHVDNLPYRHIGWLDLFIITVDTCCEPIDQSSCNAIASNSTKRFENL